MGIDKKEKSRNELKTSFKNLQQLIENINNAISLGIMKIDHNTVYIFKEIWSSWDKEAKSAFCKNIIAFYKVKYNADPGLNIFINDIETNKEIGFIMTDLKELIESI